MSIYLRKELVYEDDETGELKIAKKEDKIVILDKNKKLHIVTLLNMDDDAGIVIYNEKQELDCIPYEDIYSFEII